MKRMTKKTLAWLLTAVMTLSALMGVPALTLTAGAQTANAAPDLPDSYLLGKYFSNDWVWYDAATGHNQLSWKVNGYPEYQSGTGMTYLNNLYLGINTWDLFGGVSESTGMTVSYTYTPQIGNDHRHILSLGLNEYSGSGSNADNHFYISATKSWMGGEMPFVGFKNGSAECINARPADGSPTFAVGQTYSIVVTISVDNGVKFNINGTDYDAVYYNSNFNGQKENIRTFLNAVKNYQYNYIGVSRWGDGYFTGSIKDLCIYGKAFTKAQLDAGASGVTYSDSLIAEAKANFDVSALTAPVFTAQPRHVDDPITDAYANYVYSDGTSWSGDGLGDTGWGVGRTSFKVAVPLNNVLVYDGGDVIAPVTLESWSNDTGGQSQIIKYVALNTELFALQRNWQGYSSTWNVWAKDHIATAESFSHLRDTDPESPATQRDGASRFWWNTLKYQGSGNTLTYFDADYNISYHARTAYRNSASTSHEFREGDVTSKANYYVINYKPIRDILADAAALYNNNVAGKEWMYTDESLNQCMLALYLIQQSDPNHYDYTANTAAAVRACANTIHLALIEYNKINLVKKQGTANFLYDDGTAYQTVTADYGDAFVPAVPEKEPDALYYYTDGVWSDGLASDAVMSDDYAGKTYTASYTQNEKPDADYSAYEAARGQALALKDLIEDEDLKGEIDFILEITDDMASYADPFKADYVDPDTGKTAAELIGEATDELLGLLDEIADNDGEGNYTLKEFTITWFNEGEEIGTSTVTFGSTPAHDPVTTSDAQYTYTSVGWTPDIEAAIEDAEYTAVYDKNDPDHRTVNNYSVTISAGANTTLTVKNGGADVNSGDEVPYGTVLTVTASADAAYSQQEPLSIRINTETLTGGTYTVTGETVIRTDPLTEDQINKYTVKFYDKDGHEITDSTQQVAHGADAVPPADQPDYTDDLKHYTFDGWSGYTDITADTDIHATFTGAAHVFDQQNTTDPDFKKSDATCTSPAVYYYSCVCGVRGDETFTSGDPAPHQTSHQNAIPGADCTETGTIEYWVCSGCGHFFSDENAENQITNLSDGTPGPHNYSVQNATTERLASQATCIAKATYYFSCAYCGAAGTETFESGDVDLHNHATTARYTVGAVEPCYTYEGYTGDKYCAACDNKAEDGESIGRLNIGNNATYQTAVATQAEAAADPDKYDEADVTALNGKLEELADALAINDNEEAVLAILGELETILDGMDAIEWVTVTFKIDGETVSEQRIVSGESATAPAPAPYINDGETHRVFSGWNGTYTNVTADVTIVGTYDAADHVWEDGDIILAPTCSEKGTQAVSCVCGAGSTKQLDEDAYNHADYGTTIANAVEAKCNWDGYTGDTVCARCGATLEPGTVIRKETIAHTPGEPVESIVTPATCGQPGVKNVTVKCTVCGTTISVTPEPIPATGEHTTVKTNARPATCVSDGNIAYWICSVCGKYFADADGTAEIGLADTVIGATGVHTLVFVPAKEPTSTEAGNIAYYVCSVCGKYFADEAGAEPIADPDSVVIPAVHAHELTHVPAKEPTATENGNEEYWYCAGCGKYFEDPDGVYEITDPSSLVIPKTGGDTPTPSGNAGACPYCGQRHTGFFGALLYLIHVIVYFFRLLFGLH